MTKTNLLVAVRGQVAWAESMAICLSKRPDLSRLMEPLDIDALYQPARDGQFVPAPYPPRPGPAGSIQIGDAEAEIIESQVLDTARSQGSLCADIDFTRRRVPGLAS